MRLPSTAAALLLALATAGPARAVAINVTLSGTIEFVDSQISSAFTVGAPFTASFQINSDTPDTDALPTEGEYIGAVSNLSFSFGSYSGAGAGDNQLHMRDGAGLFADNFFVQSEFSGADVAGFPPFDFLVNLADTSLTVFTSDAIPASLDLADFDIADALLGFQDGSSIYRVQAGIDALTYTVVPEPGTLPLLGLGCVALAGKRRR